MRLVNVFLMFILFYSSGAQATPVNVLSPEGESRSYLGEKIFCTEDIQIEQRGGRLEVAVSTNYPGPHADVEYNRADLFIEKDGQCIMAVKLGGRNVGLVIYSHDKLSYETSQYFEGLRIPFGRHEDGSFIPVQAHSGQTAGKVDVEWKDLGGGKYSVNISIPLDVFRNVNVKGLLKFSWPTAFCGNSLVEKEFYLILPEGGWGGAGPGFIPPAASCVAECIAGICGGGEFSSGGGGGSEDHHDYHNNFHHHHHHHENVVPIPATSLLLATGLVALLVSRRKK